MDGMKELKRFIEGLIEMEYEAVGIGEIFEESSELIKLDKLIDKIRELGIKEVVAEYFESFEFITNDGKYIEICGVY